MRAHACDIPDSKFLQSLARESAHIACMKSLMVIAMTIQFWGVRYQVTDLDRSVDFYTKQLGFTLEHRQGAAFAKVTTGALALLLSGNGSSGARPLPGGRKQTPGGFNRIVLRVEDLPARIEELKKAGVRFRNEMEVGPGGRQIQIEDPDGNPVELFEPGSR